jgi:hypothetical protein
MSPVVHHARGCASSHEMLPFSMLSALLLLSCAGCSELRSDSLGSGAIQTPLLSSAPIPGSTLVDVRWLPGEWRFIHDLNEVIRIEHVGLGRYTITPATPESRFTSGTLAVFDLGCLRLVEVQWDVQQPDNVGYAVLNGYAQRLSIDVVPAIFPAAWRDPELLAELELEPGQEVAPEMRGPALSWFARQIDSRGTLMHQDMTFYQSNFRD